MKNQQGLSILELLISLAVGLALVAGVLSVFVGMKTTTEETSGYGELQENGRFALSLISSDLSKVAFWGDYTGALDRTNLTAVPVDPGNECTGEGLNNGSFPQANGQFRAIWGKTVDAAAQLGCISDAVTASDLLQLKRVITNQVAAADVNASKFYLNTNISSGEIFSGGGAVPNVDNGRIWEYQHHVYYVRQESHGTNKVPVLMMGQLTNNKMDFQPLIDGIEKIRFMYGIDTTGNGLVNTFIRADNLSQANWNNAGSDIVAVKIYVLVRNILPDNDYTDNNSYQLGDVTYSPNDNYRRLLYSATVTLFNAKVDQW